MFDRYNRRLYGVAYRYSNVAENSKEIVQEAWIEIFKSLHGYTDKGNLYGWLKTILIRTAWRNMKKAQATVEMTFDLPHLVDGQQQLMERLTCNEILNLLDAVPKTSRMVFKLFVIDGYKHKEIAAQLNIIESTSRAHLSKARKILKQKYFALNKLAQ